MPLTAAEGQRRHRQELTDNDDVKSA